MAGVVDIGASVVARLKKKAQKEGLQLQLLLNLFCQEEFLFIDIPFKAILNEDEIFYIWNHEQKEYVKRIIIDLIRLNKK